MIAAAILGLGAELVDVARFERAAARFGERLLARLFTPGERAYAARRARGVESLAVRFAAKVAAHRALGLRGPRWQDVEVVRERGRAPTLRLHGAAQARARALGVGGAALSLTHDRLGCIGHVVLTD